MIVIGWKLAPIVQSLQQNGKCSVPYLILDTEMHFVRSLSDLPGVSVVLDEEEKVIHLVGVPKEEGIKWRYDTTGGDDGQD